MPHCLIEVKKGADPAFHDQIGLLLRLEGSGDYS